jgi:Flp pilus assembly protein TadD
MPEQQPSRPPQQEALAVIYSCALKLLSSGDLVSAMQSLQSLHEVQPDNPDYLNDLGVVLTRLGRADLGLKLISKAAVLAPSDRNILENLEALQKLNDPKTTPAAPSTLLETLKLLAETAWSPDLQKEGAKRAGR